MRKSNLTTTLLIPSCCLKMLVEVLNLEGSKTPVSLSACAREGVMGLWAFDLPGVNPSVHGGSLPSSVESHYCCTLISSRFDADLLS